MASIAPDLRSGYPRAMIRLSLCAVLVVSACPVSAAKPPAAKSWKFVIERVMAKGVERPIKAPTAKNLGYDRDEVGAKTLRIKSAVSADKREHSVAIVYDKTIAKELVLGTMLVTDTPKGKSIDGYRLRAKLDGTVISAMHSSGIVGEVEQTVLKPDSPEVKALLAAESELYLKKTPLDQLTE